MKTMSLEPGALSEEQRAKLAARSAVEAELAGLR